jgi:hypothetical protein
MSEQKGTTNDALGQNKEASRGQDDAKLKDEQLDDIAAGRAEGGEGMARREPDPDRMPLEPLKKPQNP